MMNIRIDDRYAYVELEVFGAYQPERMNEVVDAMNTVADRHGRFSILEIQHGKPQNFFSLFRAMSNLTNDGETGEEAMKRQMRFAEKMKKYALVSDDPPILMRLAIMFSRSGNVKMRLFPMHERDAARLWIEERAGEDHSSVPASSW